MVVIAHPDDAEYGCAGTVAKWCRQGMSVVYVVCTDGSKGSPDPNVDVGWLIETRQQEQRNACKVLGVEDVVFLNYEDAMLEPTLELRKDIAREIRRYRPDVMICETPMRTLKGHGYIGHPDHFASGEAAMAAMFPAARDRLTFPDLLADGFEPHKIRELMIMTFGRRRRRQVGGRHRHSRAVLGGPQAARKPSGSHGRGPLRLRALLESKRRQRGRHGRRRNLQKLRSQLSNPHPPQHLGAGSKPAPTPPVIPARPPPSSPRRRGPTPAPAIRGPGLHAKSPSKPATAAQPH